MKVQRVRGWNRVIKDLLLVSNFFYIWSVDQSKRSERERAEVVVLVQINPMES